MLIKTTILVLISVVNGQNTNVNTTNKVTTTEGVTVGVKANDGDYLAFYGIPYAGSVTGNNRFKAAPPPTKYQGEFHAVDNGILCAQPSLHGLAGVEDCLTLNVFTNNITGRKPVIVWLNGEEYANTNDTPRYSYRTLVADVVFIAINYRLSIFGFLCLGVAEAPGNAGLKDVIHALKWIQENAAAFGGDPNNVVLLGHGSGAAMVDLVTMSPLSENLVHKAIALSGSAIAPWAVAFDPLGYARAFGASVGYTDDDQQKLAKHLAGADINVLVSALSDFKFTNNSILFAPCVENTKLPGSFLEDAPLNLLRSGKYRHIPYIASYVDVEGTLRAAEASNGKWLEMMQQNFVDFLPVDLNFANETTRRNIGQYIRRFYFADREIDRSTIADYLEYQSDTLITVSVIRGVSERAANSTAPVRLLKFFYKEGINRDWPYPDIPLNGMRHGGILNYIFDLESSPVDEKPRSALIKRFVAFANTGNPVATTSPGDTAWEPITATHFNYLGIEGSPATGFVEDLLKDPHSQTIKFWNDTCSTYYITPQQVSSASGLVNVFIVIFISQLIVTIF